MDKNICAHFGSTYTKIGTIQRRLAWPLCKDDMQIHEAFPILQPRCPSTDEWIKKLWYIYTMESYSTIKRNTFKSVLMRWMNLESIIQSEISQKGKDKYHILTHMYRIQKNSSEEFIYMETMEKQTQGIDLWTWGRGEERRE